MSDCGTPGRVRAALSPSRAASLTRGWAPCFVTVGVLGSGSSQPSETCSAQALCASQQEVSPGCRVFMLSRSNGIEWLGVYGVPDEATRLFQLAQERSKPFKRWFEVSD